MPDFGPLGSTAGGAIGIAAREPFARDVLEGVLDDLRAHVERFLRN